MSAGQDRRKAESMPPWIDPESVWREHLRQKRAIAELLERLTDIYTVLSMAQNRGEVPGDGSVEVAVQMAFYALYEHREARS